MRIHLGRDCGGRDFPGGLFGMNFGPGRGWSKSWELGRRLGRRRRPRPGRRGRGRVFDGGELRLVLLQLIAEQPRHGYDLIQAIEEITHGAYAPSPGVVYPTLTMLADMGLIEEAKSEGSRKAILRHRGGQGPSQGE